MNWANGTSGKEEQEEMKRGVVLTFAAILACSSIALAGRNLDQERTDVVVRAQGPRASHLGVELGEVTRETMQRLKLREERGALIESVITGSAAADAGLQKDDVILKWNGEPIESVRELSRRIQETPPGRTIRLGVARAGRDIDVNVKMGNRAFAVTRPRVVRAAPVARVRVRPEVGERLRDRGHLGVELQSMTEQLAEYFGVSKRTGALVVFVFADSPAAKAGLKAGDVILSADGKSVERPNDLRQVLIDKPEGSIELRVMRDKQERTFQVQVQKGTNSWLLNSEDECAEVAVRAALAPLALKITDVVVPKISIAAPSVSLAPMSVQVPRIKIAPVVPTALPVMPMIQLESVPLNLTLPKISIHPVRVKIQPRSIVL